MFTVLFLFFLAPRVEAAQNVVGANALVFNYTAPAYIIDSDAEVSHSAYTRNLIPLRCTAVFIGTTSGFETQTYRAGFRMLDMDTGQAVPVAGGGTNQRIFSSAQTVTTFSNIPISATFNVQANPSVRLDPYKRYQVEVIIQRRESSGGINFWVTAHSTVSAEDYGFIHFTGPRAIDSALNIVSSLNSVVISRRHLIETDPTAVTFAANVNFTLHRYDNPTQPQPLGQTEVVVRLDLELLARSPDFQVTVIPLQSDVVTLSPGPLIAPHAKVGSLPAEVPVSLTSTRTIQFRAPPGVEIDPVTHDYALRVRITHLEDFDGFTPVFAVGNTERSVFGPLLHFNGSLRFGDIMTTMQSVSNVNIGGTTIHPPTHARVPLTFAPNGGYINDAPGYTYGPGSLAVHLLPNGDAEVAPGGSVNLVPPASPDHSFVAGVRYTRALTTLSGSGASTARIDVRLPAGFGWMHDKSDRTLNGFIHMEGPLPLKPDLTPVEEVYGFVPDDGGPMWVSEETTPVIVNVSKIEWYVAEGRFALPPAQSNEVLHVRTAHYNALAGYGFLPANMRIKRSNDQYWHLVTSVDSDLSVRAGHEGGAELSGTFHLAAPGNGWRIDTHFPHGAYFVMADGMIRIEDDRVVPAESILTTAATFPNVFVPVSSDCVHPSCGTVSSPAIHIAPVDRALRFTEDGGLVGAGPVGGSGGYPLEWGRIPGLNRFAHKTDPFTEGNLHIPGHFLPGGISPVPLARRPAVILFSGATTAGMVTERPPGFQFTLSSYHFGNADYAGINFRAGAPRDAADSGMLGESTLGGGAYGPYSLKRRSKYYVRKSGISGIHDKVQTSPETVFISGYEFTFLNFGLAFLSNVNVDSRTEGSLRLPYPSDYTIDFERLRFLCNGALDKADVAGGIQQHTAAYWNALLNVSAISFQRDPAQLCNPSEGFLALGVTTYAAHVEDEFDGVLGVFPHGNLIPKNGGPADLDSRLIAPSQVRIRGPRRAAPGATGFETYTVTPTSGAFLNVLGTQAGGYVFPHPPPPASPPGSLAQGFMNVPGLVRVSFFEALEGHLQMPSIPPPEDPAEDPAGWGSAMLHISNGTWGSTGFFMPGYHDPDNRGFPGNTHTQLDNYRTGDAHRTRAKQKWLNGAISFDFPLLWDFATRSFRSHQPVKDDFVVLTLEQRVAYLSAERAEVRFGAQAGLPQINLANFVINTLDDLTGVSATLAGALEALIVGQLDTGLGRLDDILADHKTGHYENLLGTQLDAITNHVYNFLHNQWNNGTQWPVSFLADFENQYSDGFLNTMIWGGLSGANQAAELQNALNAAIAAVDEVIGTGIGGGLLPAAGSTDAVRSLAAALVRELAGSINSNLAGVVGGAAESVLNEMLAPHLNTAAPTFADLRVGLEEIRAALVTTRNRLNAGGDFRAQLQQQYLSALSAEFPGVSQTVRNDLATYVGTFNATNRFHWAGEAVVKQKIRRAFTDRLYGTEYVAATQTTVKHRVFDINTSLRSALGSAFGQVNEVVRATLTAALTDLDTGFAPVLGLFSDFMGSAGIDGYAIFNGNALRQVRIDGKFQWSVPEKTTFSAFLEINQYESGSDKPPCGDMGKDAAEVILGAHNVPCDFLSPDMRVNIETKFSFEIENGMLVPIGFAGSFVMTEGEVSFQAFTITDLAVAVAFGKYENYLSAALGLRFNGYKAKGGIFFGRTCTLMPIMAWDMFVAAALGMPDDTFTGAYVYGECHIPVSQVLLGIPASCVFQVSAGMGMGMFYFIEGPTYGARGMLSVSGDALCLFSIGGSMDLVGLKQGNKFKVKGKGTFYVEFGVCPFCFKGNKTVHISAEAGGGSMSGGKVRD
ncbi:MAG: hypothetical protein JJU00_04220 [Opitutales bacterium]|nr:hypothetical protein [Opitutales bacterium]